MEIISTGASSAKYGGCEKCGKDVSEIVHVFGESSTGYRNSFCCTTCANEIVATENLRTQKVAIGDIKQIAAKWLLDRRQICVNAESGIITDLDSGKFVAFRLGFCKWFVNITNNGEVVSSWME